MLLRPKDKNVKRPQLGLGLKFSQLELFYKFKRFAAQVEKNFTALPFWRNGIIWISIVTIIGVTIISTLLISKHYLDLPEDIPLIYDTLEAKWKSFPKFFFFSVPLILIIIGICNLQILTKVYYMNKRLTLMICLVLTASYFLVLIAVNEILIISTS